MIIPRGDVMVAGRRYAAITYELCKGRSFTPREVQQEFGFTYVRHARQVLNNLSLVIPLVQIPGDYHNGEPSLWVLSEHLKGVNLERRR